MKQSKEAGLAHVGLVITGVIVIVVAVAVGWYVWQKDQQTSNKTQSTNTQEVESKEKDPSEDGKYLVIQEWGIRFELPEELRGDIGYYASDAAASGTVLFSSKKLNALTTGSACDIVVQPDGQYAGGLEARLARLNPKTYDQNYLEYYKSQLTFLTKINEYEYYYVNQAKNPPITCVSESQPELNSTEQEISDGLKSAFTKLEDI